MMGVDFFIESLRRVFISHEDSKVAVKQKAYMRDLFEYHGIMTVDRRKLQKAFLVRYHLPNKSQLDKLVKALWSQPERDYQYVAQEITFKFIKQLDKKDIKLFEYMIIQKSWWDTVDFIASKLVGEYFKKFPDEKVAYVEKWRTSKNIWLQRSSLLFQLKYKKDLDKDLLSATIKVLLGTGEFFIDKAIGWVLREYSRTDAKWVIDFVEKTPLGRLSRREALKLWIKS